MIFFQMKIRKNYEVTKKVYRRKLWIFSPSEWVMMHARQTRKCINPVSTFGVVLQKSQSNDIFRSFSISGSKLCYEISLTQTTDRTIAHVYTIPFKRSAINHDTFYVRLLFFYNHAYMHMKFEQKLVKSIRVGKKYINTK